MKLGVAFRDLAGPVFMDLVQELRNLGKQLNCCQKIQISQFIQSSSIDTSLSHTRSFDHMHHRGFPSPET